jgi:hypothetical protein
MLLKALPQITLYELQTGVPAHFAECQGRDAIGTAKVAQDGVYTFLKGGCGFGLLRHQSRLHSSGAQTMPERSRVASSELAAGNPLLGLVEHKRINRRKFTTRRGCGQNLGRMALCAGVISQCVSHLPLPVLRIGPAHPGCPFVVLPLRQPT